MQKKVIYDKSDDSHYDTISAFIKSMRGSDPDATLHYLARMLEGGEDPMFIARRIVIQASEDVGAANNEALIVAVAAMQAVHQIGMPEARIILAQAAVEVAMSPKSNASYLGINQAIGDVKNMDVGKIPMHIRNAEISGMENFEYGVGYKYPHDFENGYVKQQYLPDELKDKVYYNPKNGRKIMRKGRINNSEINNEDLSKGIEIANKHKTQKEIERSKRIKRDVDKTNTREDKRTNPLLICLICVIVFILLFVFLYYGPLFGISINRGSGIDDKNKIDIVSTDSDIYESYCSDLLIYNNQKITTYNSRGKKTWEYELSTKFTPNIYIQGKFMAVSNNSNGKIYLFEDKKEILNTKIDGEIDEIFIDESGNYVVEYSTSGYKKF